MGRRKILMHVLLLHFFAVGTAYGKCPYRSYEITGIVQEDKTGQLIMGAKLFFFFDNTQCTLANGNETKYPDYFKTDEHGSFTATAYFYTYSGWFLTDRCNKKPKNLTVITTAEGFLTKRTMYPIKKLIDPDGVIRLPPISLTK